MSLIQEALRRQQEEMGRKRTGAQPAAPAPASPLPPVPETAAPAPAAEPERPAPSPRAAPRVSPLSLRSETPMEAPQAAPIPLPVEKASSTGSRHTWPTLVGVLVVLFVLVGLVVWLGYYGFRQFAAATARLQTAATAPATAPADATPPASTAPVVPPPVAPVVAPVTPTVPPPPTPAPVAAVVPPPPAPTASEAVPPVPPVVVAEQPATPPPPSEPEGVVWPELVLTGVVGKGDKGSAIINGQILGSGESIDGCAVMNIQRQGVELEYKGERLFLKVGNSSR